MKLCIPFIKNRQSVSRTHAKRVPYHYLYINCLPIAVINIEQKLTMIVVFVSV